MATAGAITALLGVLGVRQEVQAQCLADGDPCTSTGSCCSGLCQAVEEPAAPTKKKKKKKGKKKRGQPATLTQRCAPVPPSNPPPADVLGCTLRDDSCSVGVSIPCPGNPRHGRCVVVDGKPFCAELAICGTCVTDGDCGPGRRCAACPIGCEGKGGKVCLLASCGAGQIPAGSTCVTGQGTCPTGATSCRTPSDPAGTTVPCNGVPGCRCFQSAAGDTRCGKNPPAPIFQCGQCTRDSDCDLVGFGAFCVVTTVPRTNCACATAGQGFCQLPC